VSNITIAPDSQQVAHAAAEYIIALAQQSIATSGRFALALAGGSTPRTLYQVLASEQVAPRIAWRHVYVFWGDERCVPPDHAESNYHMAYENLLQHVPVPPAQVYRMRGEAAPEQAATEYTHIVQTFFGHQAGAGAATATTFDLVLLGMGDDGHTASLFPGNTAADEHEHQVVATFVEQLGAWRLTLTAACINTAAHVLFLVTGAPKAERLHQVLHGAYQPELLPAQRIKPVHGRLQWVVDEAAARLLPTS
jgi:6-phosphogluconolactonase